MRELDDVHDIIAYNIQMGSCVCEDNAAGRLSTGLYAAAVRAYMYAGDRVQVFGRGLRLHNNTVHRCDDGVQAAAGTAADG